MDILHTCLMWLWFGIATVALMIMMSEQWRPEPKTFVLNVLLLVASGTALFILQP